MQTLISDPTFPFVVALAVIVAAGIWEVFTYKVPNALTLTACAAGLVFAVAKSILAPDAEGGLMSAIVGLVAGGAMLLPLQNKLGLGAGCVKADAAFGVWVGCAVGVVVTLKLLVISSIVGMAVLLIYARSVKHNRKVGHAQFPISVGVVAAIAILLILK